MDPEDRRSVLVSLTASGLEMAERAQTLMLTKLSGLVEYLGSDKSRELVKLMGDAIEYIEGK